MYENLYTCENKFNNNNNWHQKLENLIPTKVILYYIILY